MPLPIRVTPGGRPGTRTLNPLIKSHSTLSSIRMQQTTNSGTKRTRKKSIMHETAARSWALQYICSMSRIASSAGDATTYGNYSPHVSTCRVPFLGSSLRCQCTGFSVLSMWLQARLDPIPPDQPHRHSFRIHPPRQCSQP